MFIKKVNYVVKENRITKISKGQKRFFCENQNVTFFVIFKPFVTRTDLAEIQKVTVAANFLTVFDKLINCRGTLLWFQKAFKCSLVIAFLKRPANLMTNNHLFYSLNKV